MGPRRALALLWPAVVAGTLSIPLRQIAHGVRMPVLSIGTGGLESKEAYTIVQDWLGLGARGVDTAWIYRDQEVVAKAISDLGVPRGEVFITTKIPGCADVKAMVEADLKQLGTDYLDLLLIHFPRMGDCSQAWTVLEDFHARGVLKAIGVSNFRKSNLEALLKTAKVVPAVNQIEHNVLNHDDETIAFSEANNITIEAYSPLGRSNHSGDIPGNEAIQAIAASHNVSAYQVALKWILQHGHILTFQSTSQQHQQVDADLFGFNLTKEEMSTLDRQQKPTLGSRAELLML